MKRVNTFGTPGGELRYSLMRDADVQYRSST
jgi:hypothetical protein